MSRLRHYIILLLFLGYAISVAAQTEIEVLDLDNPSLEEVVQELEKDYSLLFSYQQDLLKGIYVSLPTKKLDLDAFLFVLLENSDINYEIVQDNYIVLTPRKKENELTQIPEKKSLFCGKITCQLTNLPLPFANAYLSDAQTGISANDEGYFEFQSSYSDSDSIVLSYVGYVEQRFSASDFIQKDCPTIVLEHLELGEDFVVVTDYLTDGISLNNKGAYTKIRPQKVGALPGQVEPDILTTLQFLPGISSANGSPSSLHIRGGTPDQNLILWEGIPMYHSAHYYGMISAFNPYIMDEIDVYRGGFGAEYGGRVAGVIDMKSEDYQLRKTQIGLGSNFINAFANGQIALAKDKASAVFSVRHSTSELGRTPTYDNIVQRIHQGIILQNIKPGRLPREIDLKDDFKFIDSNAKISWKLSLKDELSIAGFYTNNDLESEVNNTQIGLRQTDSLYLQNQGLSLAWKRNWNERFSSQILALSTNYFYDYEYNIGIQNDNMPNKDGFKNSQITETQLQWINNYQTNQNHTIKLGYQLSDYDIGFGITKQKGRRNETNENEKNDAYVHALHGTFTTNKEHKFGAEIGLRTSYFQKRKDIYWEPRLQFWYQIREGFQINANLGQYYQFLSQVVEIEGDQASITTPIWVLNARQDIPVLNALQAQLGSVYQKKSWLLEVQAYYKNLRGLTSLSLDFVNQLENRYTLGYARIYGIDFLVKKRWKNYRTWLSYSFGRVIYEFDDFFDEQFPAASDQPHQLNWVHLYKKNNWNFSLGWKLVSGTPYSDKDDFRVEEVNDPMMNQLSGEIVVPLSNQFNQSRLSMLHQLNASAAYTLKPKDEAWKAVFGLSLFNVYDQNNIYSRGFFIEQNEMMDAQLNYTNKLDLGFTPNLLVRFEW